MLRPLTQVSARISKNPHGSGFLINNFPSHQCPTLIYNKLKSCLIQRIPNHFSKPILVRFPGSVKHHRPNRSPSNSINGHRSPSNPQDPIETHPMEPLRPSWQCSAHFGLILLLNPEVRYSRRSAALEAATSGMEDLVACPAARDFCGKSGKSHLSNGRFFFNTIIKTDIFHHSSPVKWKLNQQNMGMTGNDRE